MSFLSGSRARELMPPPLPLPCCLRSLFNDQHTSLDSRTHSPHSPHSPHWPHPHAPVPHASLRPKANAGDPRNPFTFTRASLGLGSPGHTLQDDPHSIILESVTWGPY